MLGLVTILASFVLAAALIKFLKVARPSHPAGSQQADAGFPLSDVAASPRDNPSGSMTPAIEEMRSLLRRAVSSLTYPASADEARALCEHIAAFELGPLPRNADMNMRESYAAILGQFILLRAALESQCSSSEAATILIEMNANLRRLAASLASQ